MNIEIKEDATSNIRELYVDGKSIGLKWTKDIVEIYRNPPEADLTCCYGLDLQAEVLHSYKQYVVEELPFTSREKAEIIVEIIKHFDGRAELAEDVKQEAIELIAVDIEKKLTPV